MEQQAQVILINAEVLTHEIFSFRPHGENRTVYFDATEIRRFCKAFPNTVERGMVSVTPQIRDQIVNNGGVEIAKVMRLLARPDIYNQPVIFLAWPDGTHVMCDGNHRFVIKTEFCGKDEIEAYIVPQEVWERFVVPLPPELDVL